MIPLLGQGFFYELYDTDQKQLQRMDLSTDASQDDVIKFIRQGRDGWYSGIVKEYHPDDPLIERENIVDEMLLNLLLLYPLYDYMAWRP
jgi:hypothetical protein